MLLLSLRSFGEYGNASTIGLRQYTASLLSQENESIAEGRKLLFIAICILFCPTLSNFGGVTGNHAAKVGEKENPSIVDPRFIDMKRDKVD